MVKNGEEKMEKVKKRLLFDHPILSMIIMPVLLFFIISLAESFIADAIMATFGSGTERHLAAAIGEIIPAAIILIWHVFWFRDELHHFFSAKHFGKGFLIGWGVVAVPILLFAMRILSIAYGEVEMGNPILAIIYGFAPGLGEEVIFRIIPISIAMRSRNKKVITIVLVVTSLMFGLIHGGNILVGADPVQTLMQVIYATGLGLTFAAIYLRTGNIWIMIFVHTFTDFVSYMGLSSQESGGVLADKADMVTIIYLSILSVIFFVNAFVAFRKSKREEIPAVWDEIWGREALEEVTAQ